MKIVNTFHRSDVFDEKTCFSEFHHYELYDKNKTYQEVPFIKDYGYGEHKYLYVTYLVSLNNGNELKYIVAEEDLSKEELNILSKFCRCEICTAGRCNIIARFFICSCCIGCLKSPYPQQYQINKTRKFLASMS